jgi:hypothetical protein
MIFLVSCKKESVLVPPVLQESPSMSSCIPQTGNPSGRSYTSAEVEPYTCTSSHCGLIPLNRKNYWVYQDSLFNNGIFDRVQVDTLRFTRNWRSLTDGLIWWESNISIGLPEVFYANDSTIFKLEDRMFTNEMLDVKRDYTLYSGDSTRYITSFSDNAAICKSKKMYTSLETAAGNFSGYIYYEKNAPYFRRDQTYLKPGIGVIRYVQEKAVMGYPQVKLTQVSTLVAYHIE